MVRWIALLLVLVAAPLHAASTPDPVKTFTFASDTGPGQKINTAQVDTQLVNLYAWATAFSAAVGHVIRSDDTLVDSIVRLRNLHSEVSTLIASKSGWQPKVAVACSSTANLTLSGEQTIDGVLTSASRVLVKDQTIPAQNGIYVTGAGAWTRSTDTDEAAELGYATVYVTAGSVGANRMYVQTVASSAITVGTTALSWAQFSSPVPVSTFMTNVVTATSGPAALTALGVSSFAQTILDDADAATTRATIGGVSNVVSTFSALRALAGTSLAGTVQVLGCAAAGDGGGGFFRYNASDVTADNGGTIIAPTVGSGRWDRLYEATIQAKWFGATFDGVTDDTATIQAALTAGAGKTVMLPSGTALTSASLTIPANTILRGQGPSSILKASVTSQRVIVPTGSDGWSLRDFAIDGGGQTSDINTGVRGAIGIYGTNCKYWTIDNVTIYKCGIRHAVAEATDNGWGGFGILMEGRSGECAYGVIRGCRIYNIAGAGNSAGDGIYIGGYNADLTIKGHDITIQNCWASTCGRHCFTVAGGSGASIPRNVSLRSCYAEKSALDGLDMEEATQVTVDDCDLRTCGNDQTYLNPAVSFGATFRLLAGIAGGNSCDDVTISACRFDTCYYGITYGAGKAMSIDRCRFVNGTHEDMSPGLAQSSVSMRVTSCEMLSTGANMLLVYQGLDNGGCIEIVGCTFAMRVGISQCWDVQFTNCCFKAGIQFQSTSIKRPTFTSCTWTDFAGSAVSHSSVSQAVEDAVFIGCRFIGTGNMTRGLDLQGGDALAWKVIGCTFKGLTGAGIYHASGAGTRAFACINGNEFKSCGAGMTFVLGISSGVIEGNTFDTITGYCIEFTTLTTTFDMYDVTIANNVAGASVTNGLRVTLGTGTWDRCILHGNNFHTASGTKWSLAAGNAAGFVANNVTT